MPDGPANRTVPLQLSEDRPMSQAPSEPDDPQDASPGGPRDDLGQAHRAAIIGRLYDVALDPVRLEDLVDALEGGFARLRAELADGATIDDAEIEAHLGRASRVLERQEEEEGRRRRSVLDDIRRAAAFVADASGAIVAWNPAAAARFALRDHPALVDLPFEPEDRATLRDVIRRVASGRQEKLVTLRIRSPVSAGPVIVRVSRVEDVRPLALVLSTELAWPEGFDNVLREAFGLTAAETAIVRGLALGQPLRDIAAARGRSMETVRTQIRSILAKTETHAQSELVRVVLSLMDVALLPLPDRVEPPAAASARPLRSLQSGGRRLDWLDSGAPDGRAVLYMHLDYGLVRWPASAEHAARTRGLRIVTPIRAGYGETSPHPPGTDRTRACAEDYAAVLDHLGIARVVIVALGADLRYAAQLALLRPGLVAGILGCAAQLPLHTARQYERMDKWQRLILANARYAPKILPFLVKAGVALANRVGKDRFFEQVNAGSPGDIDTFARPEVREAMMSGSDVMLGPRHSAHAAFAEEAISSERDWSVLLRACPAPIRLLQGDQDPQMPLASLEELAPLYPGLDWEVLPGNGQLLFFREWRRVLAEVERLMAADAPHGTAGDGAADRAG